MLSLWDLYNSVVNGFNMCRNRMCALSYEEGKCGQRKICELQIFAVRIGSETSKEAFSVVQDSNPLSHSQFTQFLFTQILYKRNVN